MSDSDKTKEQLIEELKALRSKGATGKDDGTDAKDAAGGLTRRDVLSAWVAPVILSVPLAPRTSRAQSPGGDPDVDFAAFPTRVAGGGDGSAVQAEGAQVEPTFNPPTFKPTAPAPTAWPTAPFPTAAPSAAPTRAPTAAPTRVPTAAPTSRPTAAPTAAPTFSPTASPTVVIPVELSNFEVNG